LTTLVTQVDYPDGSTWKARYDAKGNLIAEVDALGHKTEYLNSDDGLPHTIIDATHKSKYLWWNTFAQVECFQDCSGKNTYYRYDERQHLVAVTDALNQTTTLERKGVSGQRAYRTEELPVARLADVAGGDAGAEQPLCV